MKNPAVAHRYAKALLLIGKENGKAEAYRVELGRFLELIEGNSELGATIGNPIYDASGRKSALRAVLVKMALSEAVRSFILLLFDKRRIDLIKTIYVFYEKLADELKGIVRASLVSAAPLSTEAARKISEALSRKTGKQVVLEIDVDRKLIGGIVTRLGDLVLDGSVRTQLLKMRENFKRGESVSWK
jgi:F-type H+-transporting ATPase subunit delta